MIMIMHVSFALIIINVFMLGRITADPRFIKKNNTTKWLIIVLTLLFGLCIYFGKCLYKKYERKMES